MSGGIRTCPVLWEPGLIAGPKACGSIPGDSSDPLFAAHPEKAPMTPWAAAKFKERGAIWRTPNF